MGTELLCSEPLPCCLSLVVEPWALFRDPARQLLICPSAKALITFPINHYSLLIHPRVSLECPRVIFRDTEAWAVLLVIRMALQWTTLLLSLDTVCHQWENILRRLWLNKRVFFYCAKQLAYGQSYPPSLLWMPWGDKTKGVGSKVGVLATGSVITANSEMWEGLFNLFYVSVPHL